MAGHTIGVAIPIPEPHGSELQGWRERFGDPMALAIPTHVTLLPPTDAEESAFMRIEEHLREVAATESPFEMYLRGTGSFRPVSPVVFVKVVDGIGRCERVAGRVRSGPLARQLPFPYHPHVTVAHHLPEEVLDRAFEKLAGYEAMFRVTGFSLYEHGTDGVWRPRRTFPFPSTPLLARQGDRTR